MQSSQFKIRNLAQIFLNKKRHRRTSCAQAASLVVFTEYSWTPGEIVQAEDRAHRIGQAQSVNVHYLHVKRSIDDVMWQSLGSKLDNVGQARIGNDAFR